MTDLNESVKYLRQYAHSCCSDQTRVVLDALERRTEALHETRRHLYRVFAGGRELGDVVTAALAETGPSGETGEEAK